MKNYASKAVETAHKGLTFCKFLAANDTGETGSHQEGIYIPKTSVPLIFDAKGIKGQNKDRLIKIKWQDDFTTDSRCIYYGMKTRDEYRITRFGRGFPFLKPEYTGALVVITKLSNDDYAAYVLNSEEEINYFLDTLGINPIETNNLINTELLIPQVAETNAIKKYIDSLTVDFPSTVEMALAARKIHEQVYDHSEEILTNPDKKLLGWTTTEYALFRSLELCRYGMIVKNGFNDFDTFLSTANEVLNRRKSRAGKSLEHHLSEIFTRNSLKFDEQATTENRKKPDFLFPSSALYHQTTFPTEKLITLAAKTTCKDRWRQILNEADRLKNSTKFLCTLQQGISTEQINEMETEKVQLVVPNPYIKTYPAEKQSNIWTISKFIDYVKEKEGT